MITIFKRIGHFYYQTRTFMTDKSYRLLHFPNFLPSDIQMENGYEVRLKLKSQSEYKTLKLPDTANRILEKCFEDHLLTLTDLENNYVTLTTCGNNPDGLWIDYNVVTRHNNNSYTVTFIAKIHINPRDLFVQIGHFSNVYHDNDSSISSSSCFCDTCKEQ